MGATERLEDRLTRLLEHSGARGFTFDDLARAACQDHRPSLAEIVDWLASARAQGLVGDLGFDDLPDGSGHGPRRYRRADAVPAAPAADVA